MILIKTIPVDNTYSIRQQAMYAGKDEALSKIENDTEGIHYGLFYLTELVSVASLFYNNNTVQLRKFATLPQYQNKGLGSQLLQHIITLVKEENIAQLWCNARTEKELFYTRFGFQTTATRFIKNDIAYTTMILNFVS